MNRDSTSIWYKNEHFSWLLIGITALLMTLLLWIGARSEELFVVYWAVAAILFLVMLVFFSVRVICTDEEIEVTYGIGLMSYSVSYFNVAESGPVSNDSIFSFLYEPAAELAIKITLRDGRTIFLPCQSPREFANQILARAYSR